MSELIEFKNWLDKYKKLMSEWSIGVNSVVFGAVLSAYAGVQISKLDDNFENSLLIFLLCTLHVLFLFCLNIMCALWSEALWKTKIFYITLIIVLIILPSFVWNFIFNGHFIYIAIILGWSITQFSLARMIDSVNSKAEHRVLALEEKMRNLAELDNTKNDTN